MADNDWKSRLGMVYSTDPGFNYETDDEPEAETLPAGQQDLRVWLDRKQRAGRDADLQELARMLKSRCGVGGSAKAGEIIIQGDHRDRVAELLIRSGYRCKKAGS